MVGKSYEERISNERNDAFDKLQSQLTAAQAHIALLRDAAGKYYDATSKDDRIAAALGKALAILVRKVGAGGYWCVVCGRYLMADEEGVILHDAVPHPEDMTFDEEERPQ